MDKLRTCCFIGHSTQNLSLSNLTENDIYNKIKSAVQGAIQDGYLNFLCGCEQGADLLFSEAVISEKKNNNIQFICVLSNKNQAADYNREDREQFANLLDVADSVICLSEDCIKDFTAKRNQHIINLSSYFITAYNGSRGKTETAVKYAKKIGIKTHNILDILTNDDSGQISF
ncbi:MAG: SLOG family protein [Acutalibacteraceae bacterium]|nr:SLOG family protein [Acutalibacteraceae bacterium]